MQELQLGVKRIIKPAYIDATLHIILETPIGVKYDADSWSLYFCNTHAQTDREIVTDKRTFTLLTVIRNTVDCDIQMTKDAVRSRPDNRF